MVRSILALLLSTLPILAQLGPHSDQAFLGQFTVGPIPLTNAIVSYWRLDDTYVGGFDDQRGNLHPLLTYDVVSTIAGIITNGAQTSVSTLAYVSNSASANFINAGPGVSFTVAGWFRTFENPADLDGIWCKKWDPAVAANQQWKMGLSGVYSNPAFTVHNTAGTTISVTNTIAFPDDGVWRHIAFGFDSVYQVIWIQVNGNARQTASCTEVKTGNQEVVILAGGNGGTGLGSGPAVRGDEIGVWQRSLSTADVALLYGGGLALDYPFIGNRSQQLVDQWAARVVANGGAAVSDNSKAACTNFLNALGSGGIMVKMVVVNPIVPDNLISSLTPLIFRAGSDPWINNNFVAGDLTVNGLHGNTTTKSLRTGIIPSSAISDNSAGVSLYSYTASSNDSYQLAVCGIAGAPPAFTLSGLGNALNFAASACWKDDGANSPDKIITPVNSFPSGRGFLSANRTAANAFSIYAGSSSLPFASIGSTNGNKTGSIVATYDICVFAKNAGGTVGTWGDSTLSFVAIHSGLSSGEAQVLFNSVQTLRTNLGGGYR